MSTIAFIALLYVTCGTVVAGLSWYNARPLREDEWLTVTGVAVAWPIVVARIAYDEVLSALSRKRGER
jgi:hypothetical protein